MELWQESVLVGDPCDKVLVTHTRGDGGTRGGEVWRYAAKRSQVQQESRKRKGENSMRSSLSGNQCYWLISGTKRQEDCPQCQGGAWKKFEVEVRCCRRVFSL